MAVVGAALREAVELPIGFNVLRNDGHMRPSRSAPHAGGDFVRITVPCGAMVRSPDQGVIEGSAPSRWHACSRQLAPAARIFSQTCMCRARGAWGCPHCYRGARHRRAWGLADALIISPAPEPVRRSDLDDEGRVRLACPDTPILIGERSLRSQCGIIS